MKKPWFRAKKYGWGWGLPLTWQGWVVLITFLLFIFVDFFRIDGHSHSNSDTLIGFIPDSLVASVIFIAICFLTGEKPKWRWGDKK
jgi:hypothetical protein